MVKVLAKRKRLTKKQRKKRKRWLYGLLLAGIIFTIGYITGHNNLDFSIIQERLDTSITKVEKQIDNFQLPNRIQKKRKTTTNEGISEVHIFDVDEGSSIFLLAEDGSNILIDTGPSDDSEKRIISYLDEKIGLGGKIDLLIFSHNHSDHIGHGDLVIEHFDVQEVWMNGLDSRSTIYSNLLDKLLDSTAEYLEPKAGEKYNRNAFEVEVLNPEVGDTGQDNNDGSIVTRIEFGGISLMNSGDASIPRENDIIAGNIKLKSDLLILGNHGADNSTGEAWISAVDPKLAFYQAGKDNIYNHPGENTIQRLKEADVSVSGTDELGTISIYIDEEGQLDIETSKGTEED